MEQRCDQSLYGPTPRLLGRTYTLGGGLQCTARCDPLDPCCGEELPGNSQFATLVRPMREGGGASKGLNPGHTCVPPRCHPLCGLHPPHGGETAFWSPPISHTTFSLSIFISFVLAEYEWNARGKTIFLR